MTARVLYWEGQAFAAEPFLAGAGMGIGLGVFFGTLEGVMRLNYSRGCETMIT